MAKSNKRRIVGDQTEDSGHICNVEYNSYSGGQKNLTVGPALEYVGDLGTVKKIPAGTQCYILNTTTGILYVTFAKDAAPSAGTGPGADTFPAFAASYTPIASDEYRFVIGQSGLHLYKLKDDSKYRVDVD